MAVCSCFVSWTIPWACMIWQGVCCRIRVEGSKRTQTRKANGYNAAIHAAVRCDLEVSARLILDCLSKRPRALDNWVWEYSVLPDSADAADLLIENPHAGYSTANIALSVLSTPSDEIAFMGEVWASKVLVAIRLFRSRYEEHLVAQSMRPVSAPAIAGNKSAKILGFPRSR